METHQRVGEGQPNLWTRELYDGLGRLVQSQRPAGDWENVGGGVTDGHDIIRWMAYDQAGRVLTETLPYEVEAHDSSGGQSPWVPPTTEAGTRYDYDALNRIRTVTFPDDTEVNHYYGGWTESVYDQRGHAVSYDQDAFGRLIQVREWGETDTDLYATTSYEYDAADNLVAVYDANSHDEDGKLLPNPPYVTRMEYNLLGRKMEMSDPDMGVWTYGYNAAGDMTRQVDAKSQRLCMYYDKLNRLEGKFYATGSASCPAAPDYDVTYNYDQEGEEEIYGVGQRTSMSGAWGSTHWAYDQRGRLRRERREIAAGASLVTLFTYDSADRVVTTTYPNPGAEEVTLTYNPQGLPETLIGVEIYVSAAEYNALNQPELVDFGPAGGGRTVYSYHPPQASNNRLQRIHLLGTSATLDLSYTYDDVGNVETISDAVDDGAVQKFEHDFLDRITEAWDPYTAQTWSYDPIGNITEFTGRVFGYAGSDHDHPQPHAVKWVDNSGNIDEYFYDANGNMESGGDREFEWDEENRLISGSFQDGDPVSFIYDGDGELVRKDVGGETTVYAGPHYNYNQDADVHMRYYFFGELRVAMQTNATLAFLHTDHLGSTSLATDANGNAVPDSLIRYFPYGGSRMGSEADAPTDYLFTGQRREQNLGGLFHMGARFYHPYINRFISPDTIIPDPTNPQSFNRYSYVYNNPLRYVDPSGHDPLDAAWEQAFYEKHGYWPTDSDRFFRLYSIAYAGPVSGSSAWTEEDWTQFSEHRDEVLKDKSQRSSLGDFTAAIGRISGWYANSEESQFVSGLALLYSGWPYDPTGDNIYDMMFGFQPINFCPGAKCRYFVDHGMKGFAKQYYYEKEENTHHWVGHLLFSYHEGAGFNLAITQVREFMQLDVDVEADIRLGNIAGTHARALRRGYVTLGGFASYLFQSLRVK